MGLKSVCKDARMEVDSALDQTGCLNSVERTPLCLCWLFMFRFNLQRRWPAHSAPFVSQIIHSPSQRLQEIKPHQRIDKWLKQRSLKSSGGEKGPWWRVWSFLDSGSSDRFPPHPPHQPVSGRFKESVWNLKLCWRCLTSVWLTLLLLRSDR